MSLFCFHLSLACGWRDADHTRSALRYPSLISPSPSCRGHVPGSCPGNRIRHGARSRTQRRTIRTRRQRRSARCCRSRTRSISSRGRGASTTEAEAGRSRIRQARRSMRAATSRDVASAPPPTSDAGRAGTISAGEGSAADRTYGGCESRTRWSGAGTAGREQGRSKTQERGRSQAIEFVARCRVRVSSIPTHNSAMMYRSFQDVRTQEIVHPNVALQGMSMFGMYHFAHFRPCSCTATTTFSTSPLPTCSAVDRVFRVFKSHHPLLGYRLSRTSYWPF